ncbi:MAG: hypothetical protein JSS04_14190 [Proteobacteria bacterium]|nr:hypothetical protein [Pseudomonadota bacterium]
MFEAVGAVGAGVLAFGVAFVVGYRATFGQPWISLAGLAIGEVCAGVYFLGANWIGRSAPGLLDARLVGVYLMILVFAAGLCGLAGSWFGQRKSIGLGLF